MTDDGMEVHAIYINVIRAIYINVIKDVRTKRQHLGTIAIVGDCMNCFSLFILEISSSSFAIRVNLLFH